MTRTLERIVAIIIVAVFVFVVPVVAAETHTMNCLAETGKESVTKLLAELSHNGVLTQNDYNVHTDMLYKTGYVGNLTINAYVVESSSEEQFQYTIAWSEIAKQLNEYGEYRFPNSCYIQVSVDVISTGQWIVSRILKKQISFSESAYYERGGMR